MRKAIDIERMSQLAIADFLGVTSKTVLTWRDCPRNDDRSYDLRAVVRWRVAKLEERASKRVESRKPGDLRDRRLELDCRLKELAIAEEEKRTYPREWVHGIAMKQATALREYWQSGWRREAGGIAQAMGLPASAVPGLVRRLDGLVVDMMDRWCAAGKEIEVPKGGDGAGEDASDGSDAG